MTLSTLARHRALNQLYRSSLWEQDLDAAFAAINQAAAEVLGVDRVSVWIFAGAGRERLVCRSLFTRGSPLVTSGGSLLRRDYPRYFDALDTERTIAADDARVDPRTEELAEGYLVPERIFAMLDAPIMVRGRSVGVLCHEQRGATRAWTSDEELLAASLADATALAIVSDEARTRAEQVSLAHGAASVGVWWWYPEDEVARWSAEMGPLLGEAPGYQPRTRGDYMSRVHPDDREALGLTLRRAFRGKTDRYAQQHRVLLPTGAVRWVETRGTVERDPDGELRRVLGTLMDVTGKRSLEASVSAGRRVTDLGRLSQGLAHDFNNLLMVVLAGVELAQEAEGPEELVEGLDIAMEAALRGAGLTSELLAFARGVPDSGDQAFCSPAETLRSMSRMLRSLFGGGSNLVVSVEDEGLVPLSETAFDQLLMNLVVNARDAIDGRGAVQIRVRRVLLEEGEARGLPAGHYVRVEVRDDGPGIPREHIPLLFEPLFTTKEGGRGTGLGLATCADIVELAAGRILVDSVPGETTFSVLLPRLEASDFPEPFADAVAPPVTGLKISLCTSSPEVGLALRGALLAAGHEVADHGPLGAREREAFDVVLLDLDRLPGGATVEEALALRAPKVVIGSGPAPAELRSGYLEKPFLPSRLLREIDAAAASGGPPAE